ncbi:CubicO group peptidase (beta-lactamase class C family) [Gelidibacter algens]|uniref:CubicO group peptidase (Beta-lactamase class C family) n=2 Tax=Gelidibacter algens TaxID=49280 RepID=A0A1A7QI66_9FLAO|nr:hypothetical protein A9996_18925 [Gelidibacter algens]RAJ25113.1 CubicO group peptidase (beta-lactamase class C family) [Gelidibacter algens]
MTFLSFNAIHSQTNKSYADSIRVKYSIPELSYAVVKSDIILEIAATGFHSMNLPDRATINDRFHIGSNTKAMTAFIIAKYVEAGKLSWDTNFFDIFPKWEKFANKEYMNITLRQLLTHRAGVQPFQGEDTDPIFPKFEGNNEKRNKEFSKFLLTLNPVTPDEGTSFVYSNAGYQLATLMLEKVSHKSWEQLVKEVYNDKLDIHVEFSWPENQKRKDTWGHLFDGKTYTPVPSDSDYKIDLMQASGDINLTLPDYIKFIQLNLKGFSGESNYLKADTYKYIHNASIDYAIGWFNILENERHYFTHSGTDGTYYSLVTIDRERNIAYICFTNSFSDDTQMGVRMLMRKLEESWNDK